MTNFRLKEKVEKFLKDNKGKKFTAIEISNYIIETYPSDCEEKIKNSKQQKLKLLNQIAGEIYSVKVYSNIKTIDERPRKYYYSTETDIEEINNLEKNHSKNKNFYNSEHELYPILIEYLKSDDLYAKRIDEKRSLNKNEAGSNKWLYPDVVAVENLTKDWNKDTIECAKDYSIIKTKIYSYEVKKMINRANIREVYFQAVSNSTWANFGYLVAAEISQNARKELEILNSLYGIGVIYLKENPIDSYVYIQAKERDNLDWNIIDRLIKENSDFKEFINTISDFYRNNRNETLEKLIQN